MRSVFQLTESERLLLEVVLAEPERALRAWRLWDASTGWRRSLIDPGQAGLLPMAYRRLCGIGSEIEGIFVLKGLYRRSWYKNRRCLTWARPGLEALIKAGFPLILMKGASLAMRYYRDLGVRPLADVDILVPEDQAFAALELLENLGWYYRCPGKSGNDSLRRYHAAGLGHPSGGQIDLHRYVLPRYASPGVDRPVWPKTVSLDFDGLPVCGLSPADDLLLACLPGTLWNAASPILWIVDAAAIVREAGDNLDWDRLVSEAYRRKTSLRLSKALDCLADEFLLNIPPNVRKELSSRPQAWFEAAEVRWSSSKLQKLLPPIVHVWPALYLRQAGHPRGFKWWVGLVRYLSFLQNPPPIWRDPFWLVRRSWSRVRRFCVRNARNAPSR